LKFVVAVQAYYDDIVTERSIVQTCGYPLCASPLTPQQQRRHAAKYHISLAQKKVFDLTERRKFCSNFCFQASNFYREQLETAPLWLREQQQAAARVKLLEQRPASCKQLPGKGQIVDIAPSPLEVTPSTETAAGEDTEERSESEEETGTFLEKSREDKRRNMLANGSTAKSNVMTSNIPSAADAPGIAPNMLSVTDNVQDAAVNARSVTSNVPGVTANVLHETAHVPGVPANVPDVSANVPVVTASVPDVTANVPVVTANVPDVSANVPDVSANVPVVTASVPDVTANVPDVTANVPDVTANVPDVVTANVPVVTMTTNVPNVTANVPGPLIARRRPQDQRKEEPPAEVVMRTLKLWFTVATFRFLFRCQGDELEEGADAGLRYGRRRNYPFLFYHLGEDF